MALAATLHLCVAAGVSNAAEDMGSEHVFVLGQKGHCPVDISPAGPVVVALIFSFFSPHTCSRDSTT